ncbi:hypothetical protein CCM_04109 [Cordyceps militaris CM01]|uniref:DUF3835 domain-containing protein n=1 Tax=Cordyceps militaris (strain CM01) TaxID=983644 RepID=G3JDR1_CORMM|nr:uncharacterized protein CCM_04109 [Cordyceps militaris CM01]EGX92736.1 hypothetical protein CCM_04109 [Cordyceps militaris CM01]
MVAASQAPPVHETLADMDSHIARLKGKVEQQRKALQHWQTWDAEYEALKEQVQVLAESPTDEHLQRIRADFDGELLVEKEFDDIFGHQRSRDQIVNVLDRRIDYVSQNVRSLQNQLEKAELEVLDADASNEQGAVDENGPPITEIVEELDEEGNVLSFRLNRPGEALPRVKAALEKAGIETSSPETSSEKPETTPSGANAGNSQPAKKVKESIPLPAESAQDQTAVPPVSRMAKRVDGIMKTAKEQENISSQPAIVPDDEDPDDAALRQQMLKYSMGEMGAVVAELNLEEEDDDEDDLEDDEWLEADEMDDDDDEEEDRFGRFTGRMITDKYQRRMLELETKLGVKSRFTQKLEEKAAEKDSDDDDGEGIGRIRIQSQPTPPPASPATAPTKSIVKERSSTKKEPKKGVRFANDLDIANEAEPNTTLPESKSESTSAAEPLSDLIVEREPASKPVSKPTTGTPRTQRPSRFKKAAAGTQAQPGIPKGPFDVPASLFPQQPQPAERLVPTGPAGKTIADTLVSKDSVARPADPSELDDNMVHMAVAEEHHRLRSRFIRRDGGGFSNEEEGPIEPLDDTDGGGEFMSRFKAARLSRQ